MALVVRAPSKRRASNTAPRANTNANTNANSNANTNADTVAHLDAKVGIDSVNHSMATISPRVDTTSPSAVASDGASVLPTALPAAFSASSTPAGDMPQSFAYGGSRLSVSARVSGMRIVAAKYALYRVDVALAPHAQPHAHPHAHAASHDHGDGTARSKGRAAWTVWRRFSEFVTLAGQLDPTAFRSIDAQPI
jgi:hypothetical protein